MTYPDALPLIIVLGTGESHLPANSTNSDFIELLRFADGPILRPFSILMA